ncbi:hypothetical protein HVIM_03968 (plasmid) [Roseomonas mucosa]|nr:hypothetical protein HVIM_03968 [Roseomonas mucosa]UZO94827.1 Hypothetical protein RMP42_03968 [Roseomonas mucosa]
MPEDRQDHPLRYTQAAHLLSCPFVRESRTLSALSCPDSYKILLSVLARPVSFVFSQAFSLSPRDYVENQSRTTTCGSAGVPAGFRRSWAARCPQRLSTGSV